MNIETPDHCFGSTICDIDGPMKDARTVMLTEQFDAFGEVMPGAFRSRREAPIAESGIPGRIGRCVFWLLIVTIVAARIAYYPATPAFEVGSVTGPDHALAR
jgi:hypothetical protein